MKTLENLIMAYLGESQARNRYTFYASKAKKEGFEQIAEIFETTAMNEMEHAETFFKLAQELKGDKGMLNIETMAPLTLGKTSENLKAAIEGEHEENSHLYPMFADVAEKEGYDIIAAKFRAIASVEKHHEERYQKILKLVESGSVFKRDKPVVWVCRKCGYVHTGKEAPPACPSCGHEQRFFQRLCEEY
uniref:Rubrerythrin family protein n=1 Tax=Candidatus Methanomethylicus mesodigestus TaxID=1867258 RepID=A0A7C3J1M5_9CREN